MPVLVYVTPADFQLPGALTHTAAAAAPLQLEPIRASLLPFTSEQSSSTVLSTPASQQQWQQQWQAEFRFWNQSRSMTARVVKVRHSFLLYSFEIILNQCFLLLDLLSVCAHMCERRGAACARHELVSDIAPFA